MLKVEKSRLLSGKKMLLIFSAIVFIIANVGLSQDIINETGKDGKFIVRDAEQQEALVIEDGNVGISGELSVESMPEGSTSSPYVVWDVNDKKFKTVERVFSKVSPLSEPLETKSWHSIGYGEVDDEGNEINASVQGTAANWNTFTTDNGYIKLGPATSYYAHIYTDRTRFLFNKPLTFLDAKFGSSANQDFQIQTGGINRITVDGTNGDVGIGTTSPEAKLHVKDNGEIFRVESTSSSNGWLSIFNSSGYQGYLGTYNGADDIDVGTGGGNTTGSLNLVTQATPRMTIDSDGKVGIGTTSPASNLHISADNYDLLRVQANGGSNPRLSLYKGATYVAYLGASSSDFWVWNKQAGNLYFGTNETTRMTIDSNGDVGIGTTTPGSKLSIVGLLEYADNAAALVGGLVAGDLYRTGDLLKIVH